MPVRPDFSCSRRRRRKSNHIAIGGPGHQPMLSNCRPGRTEWTEVGRCSAKNDDDEAVWTIECCYSAVIEAVLHVLLMAPAENFPFPLISGKPLHLRNRRWGGCVGLYVLQMFFFVFVFDFPFATKIPDNRSRERLNGFSWSFYQTIGGKWSLHRRTQMGTINFLGAKNYTLRTWWWRLASDWELVCWLWHCAATAKALERHERVNSFNLVFLYQRRLYPYCIIYPLLLSVWSPLHL